MNLVGTIKDKWILYSNNPLIKNYHYFSVEDIQKIEEKLIESYNLNSSINYTNPSFIFPHQFLLDKSAALNNTNDKYQNAWYYIFHIYTTHIIIIFLKEDLEKTNEKLNIHFDFLSKLKKLHPETKTIIEQEQIKIKESFKINQSAIATIKKFIKKNKIFYKEKNIDVADIEYEKLKQIVIYFLNDNNIIEEVENDCSNNKYIGLKYKLDVFFNSEKGSLYKSNIINEINNIENNFKNNSNYNPIPEINNIIKKYQFIKKHDMQSQMNMESPSNEYVRILRVKYEYLKKHPMEEEIVQLRNDYEAISIYAKFIQNDLDEINIKDKVDYYFYENIKNYETTDILYYDDHLFTLTLFFAYYSDTLDKWFQNSMINENINIKKIKINDNNIKYKQDISRETFIYYIDQDIDLIKLHQEVLKKKKLSWELFKGIEEITLTNTEECNKLVSYLSSSKDITVSKDVKSFTLENLNDIESGNITFQEGIEEINIRNVKFKDDMIITIPKSVTSLKLDYNYGINSTLVFENYDQSILSDKNFIKQLVNEYYHFSSNIKCNKTEQSVEVDPGLKVIKIIGKTNSEIIEYSFHPMILNNCSPKLAKVYLINKARKIAYEEIYKTFIKADKLLSNTNPKEDYDLFFISDEDKKEELNPNAKKYIYLRK